MAQMSWFRVINGSRVLYLGDDLENQSYTAIDEDGDKLWVEVEEYDASKVAEVSEAEAVKLQAIWDEFDEKIFDGCVQGMEPKFLEYRWRRVFIEDEIVDAQGFVDNLALGIGEGMGEKLSETGYSSIIGEGRLGVVKHVTFKKEVPMGEVLMGQLLKLKLLGIQHKEILASRNINKEVSKVMGRKMLVNQILNKYNVSTSSLIEFDFSSEEVKHRVILKFESVPMTRETAKEIGRNILRDGVY